jgi:hypothetical protein
MKEVKRLFVYDMGPDWNEGAWGMILKQLEMKLALQKIK